MSTNQPAEVVRNMVTVSIGRPGSEDGSSLLIHLGNVRAVSGSLDAHPVPQSIASYAEFIV